jgi:hypothetical protein
VKLALPASASAAGGRVTVEIRGGAPEITQKNNEVRF